ncbi:MAG: helix-turn-helix transcriptional regulator, partial [Oscillospiraceae bacterium]|nr:helix-turn-helix transcriptional regulator [Oscillospiraceae bacterium]
QHSYKSLFGVSITADISESRVNRAKSLLSTSTMPLRQIAEQCGYHSEFHLMRQFKEQTGMTPSEYRNFCK